MYQTDHVYTALKQQLKSRGMTYRDAAGFLGVSSASIKRLFSEKTLSIQRLEVLCDNLGLTLLQLIQQAELKQERVDELTEHQEQQLVDDPLLLLVAICITNRMNFDDILSHYNFPETALIRSMAALDRLDMIEFLPGNHYRAKISHAFKWRQSGPIQNYFMKTVLQDFYRSNKEDSKDYFRFVWGLLPKDSMDLVAQHMDRLASEFVSLSEETAKQENRSSGAMLISFRGNWEPEVFRELRKGKQQDDNSAGDVSR